MAKRRKRRIWGDDEKRMICVQARMVGVSVSQVARRYDVNAKLVFTWLRDPRFTPADGAEVAACFLPVEIVEENGCRHDAPAAAAENRIEIDLAGGHSLQITGGYDPEALARLIRGLSS